VPELGNFRWLTVALPGQEIAITLMTIPGPPVFEAETAAKLKNLLGKGVLGGLFFTTDDMQAAFEDLKKAGVEFTQEPTEQPYGIDAGFRDVSGNHMRITQLP
jgi:uncharacterized glyoxalase superfamily protein PhnB